MTRHFSIKNGSHFHRCIKWLAPTALLWAAGVLLLVFGDPAHGRAQIPADLSVGHSATVTDIIDGDTVVLDDGAEVRLVGLQAPKIPLGRSGFTPWPLGEEARAHLSSLIADEEVTLAYGGQQTDRYGRRLAHLIRDRDQLWIQGAMLEAGMARVYTFADNRSSVDAMLEKERLARAAGRGIWALDWYRIRTPDQAAAETDSFQIVEGVVVAVRTLRNGRIFLNFGQDWRTTLSATISADAADLFRDAAFDLSDIEGRPVRLRGWVYDHNGPTIDISHPEQIEFPLTGSNLTGRDRTTTGMPGAAGPEQ